MPDLQVINITPHTLMTTHEIVRDLANFKINKNVLPMHPSDQPAPAVTVTPAFLNSSPRAPPLYIFFMSLLVNTPDSDNQLVRSALHE